MPRFAPALGVLCAVLATACGGDDGSEGTVTPASTAAIEASRAPQPTTTVAPEVTATSPTVVPAATPEVLVEVVGPLEPLALAPIEPRSPLVPELVVYDVERGAEILLESEAHFQAWLEVSPPLTYFDEDSVRLFDQDIRQWLRLDLGEQVTQNVVSGDGTKVAVTVDGRTYLLDLAGKRTQQQISTRARPVMFSPGGTKLLLRMPEQAGLSPFVVLTVDDATSAVRLPLGASPNEIAQHTPQWLDEDHVMLVSQKSNLLQVYDVSTATPQIVLEETVESDQIVASPDGRLVAVAARDGDQDLVVVYQLSPFTEVARVDDATLGQYLEVDRGVWSADGSRLLTRQVACTEDERLAAYDVDSGRSTGLAGDFGYMYRFGFSPDGEWVAFTTHARNGYVAPADGSSPPILVSDNVNAPATPRWSTDSSRVAFTSYQGGYDICLGN